MNVFISWSGERSKAVGDLLVDWLQCVIQALNPWMSNKDIDRGALWFSEITNQLKDTSIGIICLTKENLNKPWILFEAGALSKGLSSNRVCTLLVNLEPSDIQDPLAQINHTIPDKVGMWNLVTTLNSSLGENALKEKILSQVFEKYWPEFEEKMHAIIEEELEETPIQKRSQDNILEEILDITRRMDKRIRYMELNDPNQNHLNLHIPDPNQNHLNLHIPGNTTLNTRYLGDWDGNQKISLDDIRDTLAFKAGRISRNKIENDDDND